MSGGVLSLNEVDDGLGGSSWKENFGNSGLFEGGNIGSGNDAANEYGYVIHAFFAEKIHQLGTDGVVGAGKDGKADHVDVFLDGGRGDHLRGLSQAGVDDLHAGIAEGASDDFSAAIMAVEAGFGDQDSNLLSRHSLRPLCRPS